MPTKTRDNLNQTFLHIDGNTDAEGHVSVTQAIAMVQRRERIEYTNAKLAVYYNECLHTKYEYGIQASNSSQTSNEANSLNFSWAGHYARNSRPDGVPFATNLTDLVRFTTTSADLNHRAFRSMVKRIRLPRYLSILNFLYELKDVLRMVEFWSRRRKILENISGGLLNEEFGWRPFLQDICSVLTLLKSFHKHFKKWCAEQHVPHVTHYKKILTEDNIVPRIINFGYEGDIGMYEFTSEPQGTPIAPHGFEMNVSGTIYHLQAPEWIATMKYTYYCEEALGVLKTSWALMDALNVYWDPQVLWNAIPFSFLIDWFFNVGDWLHERFSKPNLPVIIRVIDYCISAKADCLTDGGLRVPMDVPSYNRDLPSTYQYQTYQDRATVYHRHPCVPVTEDPLKVLPPMDELRKLILALALGHHCARPMRKHGPKPTGFRGDAG